MWECNCGGGWEERWGDEGIGLGWGVVRGVGKMGTKTKGLKGLVRIFRRALESNIPVSLCLYILGVDYK